jgi:hypothetical protein
VTVGQGGLRRLTVLQTVISVWKIDLCETVLGAGLMLLAGRNGGKDVAVMDEQK